MKIVGDDLGDSGVTDPPISAIESRASGTPIANVSHTYAQQLCQGLGGTYDLISNAQWQTIARNIEAVGTNWSSGTAGSGDLNRGHSEYNPSNSLAAGADSDPCFGYTDGRDDLSVCSPTIWHQDRRTFTLSNGTLLWDFAGNVMHWLRDIWGPADYTSLGLDVASDDYIYNQSSHTVLQNFGPANSYSSPSNLGFMYAPYDLTLTMPVIRGGFYGWDLSDYTGIFAFDMGGRNNGGADSSIGFRCVDRH